MATIEVRVLSKLATIPVVHRNVSTGSPPRQILDVVERVASALMIPVALPVFTASAAALWLLSRRTPFIAHRRVGWRGTTLWMFKLRTMWNADNSPCGFHFVEYIEDDHGPSCKHAEDDRVTNWFARFCRRHSIDELPQLWHVLTGEMALVGPRPVTAREIRELYGDAADEILQVKPGIAGLWQTSGRNRLSAAERVGLELEFVRRRSVRMWARILWRTVPEVWSGKNSW